MPDDIQENGDDVLPAELHRAVEACRQVPSEESMQRLRERVVGIDRSVPRRWRRRTLWVGGIAASILVFGLLWLNPGGTTWAQVGAALKEQPWIHAKVVSANPNNEYEFWYSPTRDVYARLAKHEAVFDDLRLRVSYRFDPKDKTLIRLPLQDHTRRGMEAFVSFFLAVKGGAGSLDSPDYGMELIDQRRRRVEEDGKRWDEFDMTLRHIQNADVLTRFVVQVDPMTKLPRKMSFTRLDVKAVASDFLMDYPQQGPIDIYDLEVPRDANLDDRVPPDDLNRALLANRLGREQFDSYMAIVTRSDSDSVESWHQGFPTLLWRKGNRWRVEEWFGSHEAGPRTVPADTDQLAWWKERYKQFKYLPRAVCDGKAVYEIDFDKLGKPGKKFTWKPGDPVEWKVRERLLPGAGIGSIEGTQVRGMSPELFAYPSLPVPSDLFRAELGASTAEGPAGCLLLQVTASRDLGARAYQLGRFWLDPSRSYIAMKSQWSDPKLPDDAPEPQRPTSDSYVVLDKVARSPSGYWYPTVARRKHVLHIPGTKEKGDMIYHFFVYFTNDLPDSLFRATARREEP